MNLARRQWVESRSLSEKIVGMALQRLLFIKIVKDFHWILSRREFSSDFFVRVSSSQHRRIHSKAQHFIKSISSLSSSFGSLDRRENSKCLQNDKTQLSSLTHTFHHSNIYTKKLLVTFNGYLEGLTFQRRCSYASGIGAGSLQRARAISYWFPKMLSINI